MDLDTLHRILSEDEAYVRAYAELGNSIELAIHCRSIREQRAITQAELAAEAGVTVSAVGRFERLESVKGSAVDSIVKRLKPWLRERGVRTARTRKSTLCRRSSK